MRVLRWVVGLLALGLVLGFVVGLIRPHRREVPHPVTT
jgi:hypothetical protein